MREATPLLSPSSLTDSAGNNYLNKTMGREVRRVPADWQHPKNDRGHYIPLHEGFTERYANWCEGAAKWKEGLRQDFCDKTWVPLKRDEIGMSFAEWDGECPEHEEYMPEWPEAERTHLQMYETCSEGTPISPVMKTPEELAHWLADNGASAFGSMTATYEEWLATVEAGWACSMMLTDGKLISGVELNALPEA